MLRGARIHRNLLSTTNPSDEDIGYWVAIAVAAIVVVRFMLLLIKSIQYYRKKQHKYANYLKKAVENLNNSSKNNEGCAYSLSGNLVKEYLEPITDHYELTNLLLGRGSSAEVVIGKHLKTLRRYAVKIIDSSRRDVAWRYEREMNILKDCDHTNIVRLFELYITPLNRHFVMDLCTGGHLGQALRQKPGGKFEEETARQYVLQITHAIAHCHNRGICHRDIKLQNILLESNAADAQLKLIDFGNACRFSRDSPMTKIVGTTYTAAPEVFKESYDERCDVWSIGVVAYILLCGHRPFESTAQDAHNQKSRESSIVANILMGRYHFMHDAWSEVNSASIHFVKSCLEVDYTKRRTAIGVLEHPWITHSDLHSHIGMGISRRGARSLSRKLSRNMSSSSMRRTSMIAVAFNMPSQKLQMYREIFQQIDMSGNGVLERKEFHSAMETAHPNMPKDNINFLFDTIDQDGNNAISFTEFIAATMDPKEVNMSELNAAFRLFDKDHKGYITQDDLRRVLLTSWAIEDDEFDGNEEQRQNKVEGRIASIFQQSDMNNDGVISYAEFLFAMADGSVELQSSEEFKNSVSSSLQATTSRALALGQSVSETPAAAVGDFSDMSAEVIKRSITERRQQRRQSDSRLKLSSKLFRQRSSSIIFTGLKAQGDADHVVEDEQVASSKVSRISDAFGLTLVRSNSQIEKNNPLNRLKAQAVPSILRLMFSDAMTAIGMQKHLAIPVDIARNLGNTRTLHLVENLEDSLLSEDSDDSSDLQRENDDVADTGRSSRRMSAPGLLWQTIKRRTSVFIPSMPPQIEKVNTGDLEAPHEAAADAHKRRASIKSGRRMSTAKVVEGAQSMPSDGGAYVVDEGLDTATGSSIIPEHLIGVDEGLDTATGSSIIPEHLIGNVVTVSSNPEFTETSSAQNIAAVNVCSPDQSSISVATIKKLRSSPRQGDLIQGEQAAIPKRNEGENEAVDLSGSEEFSGGHSDKERIGGSDKSSQIKSLPSKRKESITSFSDPSPENNSFTNDSSLSDAEKLQELVHFLRAQQQCDPFLTKHTAYGPSGMETIIETDERRNEDLLGGSRLIASLSTAFMAGMSAARSSIVGVNESTVVPFNLPATNQQEEDENGQNKRIVTMKPQFSNARRFSYS